MGHRLKGKAGALLGGVGLMLNWGAIAPVALAAEPLTLPPELSRPPVSEKIRLAPPPKLVVPNPTPGQVNETTIHRLIQGSPSEKTGTTTAKQEFRAVPMPSTEADMCPAIAPPNATDLGGTAAADHQK
jgi:hypothetical protein